MNYKIQNLVKYGQDYLKKNGIENSLFESILIAQLTLKKTNLELIVDSKIKLPENKKNSFLKKLFKRSLGKPISKIFGLKEFYSNEFFVNNNVLDPRPESELIIDIVKQKIFRDYNKDVKILDLGVGSGCLIISLILELSEFKATGLGVDVSQQALIIARKNIKKFNLESKIRLKKSDWFSKINKKFDVIISNPPYLKSSHIEKVSKEVNYDPQISLDGGKDGLSAYSEIAMNAKKYLKKNGFLCLEIGLGQLNHVNKIFTKNGFETILEEKDLQGINRVVVYKLNKNESR